jgi:hypothetical protein
MKVTELYPEGVQHVVHNMRAKDKAEIYATQWTDDPWAFGNSVLRMGDFGYVLHADDGEPVVACGGVPLWNGVWSIWMFATDRFDEISLSTHRFAKKVFFPSLDYAGWHRLECRSLAAHDVAHRWLELLGATRECEVSNYGKAGEAFYLYCWTKPPSSTQSTQV